MSWSLIRPIEMNRTHLVCRRQNHRLQNTHLGLSSIHMHVLSHSREHPADNITHLTSLIIVAGMIVTALPYPHTRSSSARL